MRPQAGYFVVTDIRPLGAADGAQFCRDLPTRAGVAAIPASAFYDDRDRGASLVRFAYCKRPEVLAAALDNLAVLRP